MVKNTQSQHDVEAFAFRQSVLTHALAHETQVWKTLLRPFDVLWVGIESDVPRRGQIRNDRSGSAAALQNGVCGLGANVFLDENPTVFPDPNQGCPRLVNPR